MNRFRNHIDAGKKLANGLIRYKNRDVIVFGIPRGGVIVGHEVAVKLECGLDIVAARKIPVPWASEVGFGAVTHDGTTVLNEELTSQLGLPKAMINTLTKKVVQEVKRRLNVYRGNDKYEMLDGKTVIIVDDGIATGISMLASIKFIKKLNPDRIVVAAPVASASSLSFIRGNADEEVILHISYLAPFAVSMFYEEWSEFSDKDIIECLMAAHKP